jgi:hypothetical protein
MDKSGVVPPGERKDWEAGLVYEVESSNKDSSSTFSNKQSALSAAHETTHTDWTCRSLA